MPLPPPPPFQLSTPARFAMAGGAVAGLLSLAGWAASGHRDVASLPDSAPLEMLALVLAGSMASAGVALLLPEKRTGAGRRTDPLRLTSGRRAHERTRQSA